MREQARPISHIIDQEVRRLLKVDEKSLAMKALLQSPWIEQSPILHTPLTECLGILQMLRTVRICNHIDVAGWPATRHFDALRKAAVKPLIP
ncbi:hypothetical protein WJ50_04605 [Burkholderia ubonensis]|nr:hypothetical protein WJ48_16130 [Burkholderia ubonensis]KVL68328.1 hypothetical protein WJ49_27220 [Burkholderia ubonensis]KVL96848.1 hypothetical protein WJ50_04605 [Burkholderia ubonensis]